MTRLMLLTPFYLLYTSTMADELSFISIASEYGPLGLVLLYCLYTDWSSRKEARKNEQDRILREDAREISRERSARQREDECVARIHALEARHSEELVRVAERSSRAIEALTRALGNVYRKRDSEETVVLERKHGP